MLHKGMATSLPLELTELSTLNCILKAGTQSVNTTGSYMLHETLVACPQFVNTTENY